MTTLDTPLNPSDTENIFLNDDDSKISEITASEMEKQRFTKHSALVTLLIMSIGPLSLIVQAVGEILDMYMITQRFKNDPDSHAVEMLGFSGGVGQVYGYIGMYFGQALTTKISALIGSGNRKSASKIVTDVIYLSVLSALIFSCAFVFVIRPFLSFLGTPDYLLSDTFKFIIPGLVMSPLTNLCTVGQYFLQSIGNSIFSGGVKLACYILQLGLFSPLFLFAFKVNTTFMKLGSICASMVVGLGLIYLIFKGKFSLKPDFKNLLGNFSRETPGALLSAFPLIVAFFAFFLPPTLILQSLTSNDKVHSKEIGGVFAVFTNLNTFNQAIPGAFVQGFLSAGTHAWGANDPVRCVKLFLWTLAFIFPLLFIVSVTVIPGKTVIAKAFLDDAKEIEIAEKLLPIPFYTSPLNGITVLLSMTMIVVGKPLLAFIPQLLQVLILTIGCKILSSAYKSDPTKIMYIYNINDITVFVISLALLVIPVLQVRKKIKSNDITPYEDANDLNSPIFIDSK
ncbi:hypothetical protein TRFO_38729 [Tritrichomonas foetus]|uniref:MatE family protein n=1 Tax=Tritrichomonas foetus TaxID=1144522 RepID=A0A1J4JBQ5_9EUKA|nr:hypothetical protein TRFO_38729 [Tritrichomonas foetus]|eukprot:OHS95083.1 hypothetical protein TRFO_38729 [Tritrichomonas foetus]